jgi:hypothetical protein
MRIRAAIILSIALAATAASGQTDNTLYVKSPSGSNAGTSAANAMAVGLVDPVSSYGAAGANTITTGSITSGSYLLTVASASGWNSGMGIAVHGAGPGGTSELITIVTRISGTLLTLAASASTTVTSAAVNHDDTAAIQSAINSGSNVYLRPGNYNLTSSLSVTSAIAVRGSGAGTTTLWNRGISNHVISVNYTAPNGSSTQYSNGPILEDFQIYQAAGASPTAGYGIYVTNSSGFRFRNIAMNALWGGVYVDSGEIVGWVEDMRIDNLIGGWGIYYDVPAPGGDIHLDNDELSGTNTGVYVNNSDTTEFTNLKTNNGSKVVFGAGVVSEKCVYSS